MKYFTDRSKAVLLLWVLLFNMFHFCLYYTVLSVQLSLVITCWERTDLLALLCVVFPCVFVTFPYGVSGQVWYLIVSIPDLCLLLYFHKNMHQGLAAYASERHFSIISSIIVITFLEDRGNICLSPVIWYISLAPRL